jgi:thiamine transport system permease protein
MFITFDRDPFDWRASWWLVPVGHALVAVPFVLRTVLPVLRALEPRRREAAATLGAPPLRAWWEIVGPHLRRPIVISTGLAAAISLGEFGASSFLSRTGRPTMPIAIENLLGRSGALLQAQGYALAVILAAATIAIVMTLDLTQSGERTKT